MALLNVERIKLFSTRSPYWCLALVLVIGAGFTLILTLTGSERDMTTASSQLWAQLGLMVVMVMAALSVTTEYRFGTIRNSFLAVPKRANVLVSKTVLVALIAAVIGFVTALIAYFVMDTLADDNSRMTLESATDWRLVAGNALIFALAAVIAVAVGSLIRQSAGAISILLLWPLLVEGLVSLFGSFGRDLAPWLPFAAASRFTQTDEMELGGQNLLQATAPTPLQGLLIFAATAVVIWLFALVALNRRDA